MALDANVTYQSVNFLSGVIRTLSFTAASALIKTSGDRSPSEIILAAPKRRNRFQNLEDETIYAPNCECSFVGFGREVGDLVQSNSLPRFDCSTIHVPTRNAFATVVTIGLSPNPVGKKLVSTTNTLGTSCKRQYRSTTDVVGSSPIRQVPI